MVPFTPWRSRELAIVNLSVHFTSEEMTHSDLALRAGLNNDPSPLITSNLRSLCAELLEPARLMIGLFAISSGYRSPAVNVLALGSKKSAHLDGRAADIKPRIALQDAFDILRRHPALPYDQIIIECGAWLHLAIAADGVSPRREQLVASRVAGKWVYKPPTAP
jgi:hypothetical protein